MLGTKKYQMTNEMLSVMNEDKPWKVNLFGIKFWRSVSNWNVWCLSLFTNDSHDDYVIILNIACCVAIDFYYHYYYCFFVRFLWNCFYAIEAKCYYHLIIYMLHVIHSLLHVLQHDLHHVMLLHWLMMLMLIMTHEIYYLCHSFSFFFERW